MGVSDGSAGTTSSSSAGTATSNSDPYRAFRSLVESADRKFARVRDLPPYAPSPSHHSTSHYDLCYQKVFKAYTKLWRFQQENRRELLDAGLRRWEIGEIASRIGQLYFGQYQRTSEVRFLLGAYVFYEAILRRGYFEEERGKAKLQLRKKKVDLGVRGKELRFYARFLVVALVANRMEVVRQLVDKFKALLDDCRVSFPDTNFKEWKQILQESVMLLKASTCFPTSRPLRYSELFDSHPSSHMLVARFCPPRALKLQSALLTSYHKNEVKFAEITLDTYRMLQSLEWEPTGSINQKTVIETKANGAYSDISGTSGIIDINLAADMTDSNLHPNPRKATLYRPSVPNLIAVVATMCEELSPDGILLIYISASGKCEHSTVIQNKIPRTSRNTSNQNAASHTDNQNNISKQSYTCNGENSGNGCGSCLWLGSRGGNSLNNLYPADFIPFTRRPLFFIIESDNSNTFKTIHQAERGETAVLLLSPLKQITRNQFVDPTMNGSLFTLFLSAPLQAFCGLVGLSDIDKEVYNAADSVLSTALSKWEVMLCATGCLDKVWAQVFPDPFLRRLMLRFIFCRAVLHLFHSTEKSTDHLPGCLPELPHCVSSESVSVQSSIRLLAESLGAVNHFCFTDNSGGLTQRNLK